jgi:hypothetical protein
MERSNSAMELSPELMEVQLDVISNLDCGEATGTSWGHTYKNQITENMVGACWALCRCCCGTCG